MLTTTPKRNRPSKSNRSDAVLDRLRAMRQPGESYSDVICGWSRSRRGGDRL
jgi:hypothetical protein